ncbi:hypothetical protein G1K66_01305 [Tenacibaculum finnmarkense]|uniref:hypothetical protein n=1 Tax=Tenacibaculum finnmarkense TaxID=2781243 RepID=UPI001EFC0EE6|nr:hypothetical protein [Tenacibaculum finnmarkense]MCG8784410.1 hypothetical protein [Tenacibaculum finnmarkense]MCG8806799.1 hypothetical protein [Tenacibaculum finnmarkense]MCG8811898.1 hypothetical protein [Tenacibaculum finnmarkense]MCG8817039.1 hypothetical protein [Tenacibaculum finnmarkense]
MTHKEIIKPNIDNLQAKIVDAIIKKAQKLHLNSEVINRRMLVDYLNETLHINLKEGLHIKQLLKDAYVKASYSSSIQNAIVNNIEDNDGRNKVFNPERVEQRVIALDIQNPQIDLNDFELIEHETELVKQVDGTSEIQAIQLNIETLKPTKEFSLTGKFKVEAKKDHAFKIKDEYHKIIKTHQKVKDINLNLVDDFAKTRNKLKLVREDLLQLLVDLVGDGIKTKEPKLFDVSEIKWNSFEDRYGKLNTFYKDINKEIKTFENSHEQHMGNISQSGKNQFNSFLSEATNLSNAGNLNSKNLKGAAGGAAVSFLIEGGLSVAKARTEAKKTIAQIDLDIEKLKEGMQSDVELILEDILKLGRFYSELKDKLIPQLQLASKIIVIKLINDIAPLYKQIISNTEIKDLRDSNRNLMTELRTIEAELVDKEEQIKYNEFKGQKLTKDIEDYQVEHDFLMSLHPVEPNLFYKIISPFNSKKLYKETLEDWCRYSKPFIDNFKSIQENLIKEGKLKEENFADFEKLTNRKTSIGEKLKQNSEKIKIIFGKTENKNRFNDLLENIKELVVHSKGILEVKISSAIENGLPNQPKEAVNQISVIDSKNFLLENIPGFYDKFIINNTDGNQLFTSLLVNKMNKDERFEKIDNQTKVKIASTGLACLSVFIKTQDLNIKKNFLQKENEKVMDLFLQSYDKKLESLKEEIKKNKEDFLALKNNANSMSLGQLANKINESYDPNTNTEVTGQDVDSLLNGGTLQF